MNSDAREVRGHKVEAPVTEGVEDTIKCPLGLVCYPSCYWWEDSKCIFPERLRESQGGKVSRKCLASFYRVDRTVEFNREKHVSREGICYYSPDLSCCRWDKE